MGKGWQQIQGKRGTRSKEMRVKRKNMKINRKINDAATLRGKQYSESIWTNANIQAFRAN